MKQQEDEEEGCSQEGTFGNKGSEKNENATEYMHDSHYLLDGKEPVGDHAEKKG
jgi:hypothetical protein